ncbi:MAG TPA: Uma2 family endonuclease [Kofleriaceae bacterium]|jgi:Uma2 family endonuclease|nr:Uma2 family endonuclease [Kofleriaceae bacterium]
MSAATKPLLGYDDLWALGCDDNPNELVHGEILPKALVGNDHQTVESGLTVWVGRRFNRQTSGRWPGGWWIRPEIHVVYEAHEIYCHDLAGWRRDLHPDLGHAWVRRRPDWSCEILSRGHEKRDRVDKLGTLHRAGVPHYWIVNHHEKIVEIYRNEPTGFVLIKSAGSGETLRAEPFDAVELRTSVIFGDEDDED